jgi:hypothetical protein
MNRLLILLTAISLLTACGNAPALPPESTQPAVADPTGTPVRPTDTPAEATETPAAPTDTSVPPTETPPTAEPTADPDYSGNPHLDFAQVTFVKATQTGDGTWRFDATVRHNDQGWDHYADLWQVEDLGGNVLAERVLLHPHDTEQPFTRSQSGVNIPPEITQVVVRAKCNVHGFGGQAVLVDLTLSEGENFEVVR